MHVCVSVFVCAHLHACIFSRKYTQYIYYLEEYILRCIIEIFALFYFYFLLNVFLIKLSLSMETVNREVTGIFVGSH